MHVFFKLHRPVDRPLESGSPFLPILYVNLSRDSLSTSHCGVDTVRQSGRPVEHTTETSLKVSAPISIVSPLMPPSQRTWRQYCIHLRCAIFAQIESRGNGTDACIARKISVICANPWTPTIVHTFSWSSSQLYVFPTTICRYIYTGLLQVDMSVFR